MDAHAKGTYGGFSEPSHLLLAFRQADTRNKRGQRNEIESSKSTFASSCSSTDLWVAHHSRSRRGRLRRRKRQVGRCRSMRRRSITIHGLHDKTGEKRSKRRGDIRLVGISQSSGIPDPAQPSTPSTLELPRAPACPRVFSTWPLLFDQCSTSHADVLLLSNLHSASPLASLRLPPSLIFGLCTLADNSASRCPTFESLTSLANSSCDKLLDPHWLSYTCNTSYNLSSTKQSPSEAKTRA